MFYFLALLLGGATVAAAASGGSSNSKLNATIDDAPTPPEDEPEALVIAPKDILAPAAPAAPKVVEDDDEDDIPAAPVAAADSNDADIPVLAETETPALPDSAYDIGWAGLSAEEQLIVELVNRARLDPQAEVDRLDEELAAGISSSPVEALAVVPTLSDAAEAHSEDMDDRNFFSHTDPDGGKPWDRAIEEGHSNGFVGENIGWIGSTRTSFDEQARAEAHHTNLWESDGHQQNLMSGNWSEIGLGYDYGSHNGYDGSTFVTELFGDTGASYLTGVVIEDQDGDDFYDIGEGQSDVRITAYNDDQTYGTATWDSGGYTLELPPGTYTVVFEGGDLDAPYETQVTIGNDNVKLDVIDEGGTAVMSLNASAVTPMDAVATLMSLPPIEEQVLEETEEPELMLL